MPCASTWVTSSATANAVNVVVGGHQPMPYQKTVTAAAIASTTRMPISSTTRSGRWRRAVATACGPSVAMSTWKPSARSRAATDSAMVGSSSTTRIRRCRVLVVIPARYESDASTAGRDCEDFVDADPPPGFPEPSVGALAGQHHPDGPPQDAQVVRQRPVVHVIQIEPHRFVPGQVGAAGDLPQPGDTRLDQQPAPHVPQVVAVVGGQRPGPDQRHLAPQDVDELRQLVDGAGPQQLAEREDPGIVADLEQVA